MSVQITSTTDTAEQVAHATAGTTAKPETESKTKSASASEKPADETTDESVYKLPPEDAVIYNEKKRLAKVIQSAQKQIESAVKTLGKALEDQPVDEPPPTAAHSSSEKSGAKATNSKLPLHLQKAKSKVKSAVESGQDTTEKAGGSDVDSGDAKRLQKVFFCLQFGCFFRRECDVRCRCIFWNLALPQRCLVAFKLHLLVDTSWLSSWFKHNAFFNIFACKTSDHRPAATKTAT